MRAANVTTIHSGQSLLYVLELTKMKITWNADFCAPQNDGPLNNWARLIASLKSAKLP